MGRRAGMPNVFVCVMFCLSKTVSAKHTCFEHALDQCLSTLKNYNNPSVKYLYVCLEKVHPKVFEQKCENRLFFILTICRKHLRLLQLTIFLNLVNEYALNPFNNPFVYSVKVSGYTYLMVFSKVAAGNVINMLWQLMENSLEELKLLQTVLVLLTTNTVVHDEVLSKVRILGNTNSCINMLMYWC